MSNIEKIKSYYSYVDEDRIDKVLELFSDDVYYRRCKQEIKGKDNFKKFYEQERNIKGKHTIKNLFQVNEKIYIVEGNFTGKKDDNTDLSLEFVDIHFFNDSEKIYERHTYTDQGKV